MEEKLTHRLYYLGIRWELPGPQVKTLEKLLDPIGDWVRFNEHTWFLSTSRPASEIYQALEGILTPKASVVVIALDPRQKFGWAPDWLWEWLDGQRADPPKTAAEIIGARSAGGGDLPGRRAKVGEAAED